MKNILLKELECFNDVNFKFDPAYHKYTYNGEPLKSVTTFIHNFYEPFKQDYWSKKKADDAGVPQEWILKDWQDKNDYANEVGNVTHQWIEDYFNKIYQPLPENLDVIHRINKFNKVFVKHLFKLEPIKFEVRIFSKKWKLAGTIDSIFLYKGKIIIIDYKTNGDFKDNDHPKGKYNKLFHPFDGYYKNHITEYSIQVSLYAAILREWGFNVGGGYLLYIGPGEEEAILYKCIDFTSTLENYLDNNGPI